MEIKGKIIQMQEPQTGEGKNGTWKKQQVILETFGEYPKKVCVVIWGDKIPAEVLKVGNEVNAALDIESREYSGKWYTDVKVWKMEVLAEAKENFNELKNENQDASFPPLTSNEKDDVLPF